MPDDDFRLKFGKRLLNFRRQHHATHYLSLGREKPLCVPAALLLVLAAFFWAGPGSFSGLSARGVGQIADGYTTGHLLVRATARCFGDGLRMPATVFVAGAGQLVATLAGARAATRLLGGSGPAAGRAPDGRPGTVPRLGLSAR